MSSDRITLTVPARSEYAKTVRMTVAELASRIGMSYDEVDDVRMAAEEAFVYARARTAEGGAVTFALDVEDSGITLVVGPVDASGEIGPDDELAGQLSSFILQSVCDEFCIDVTPDGNVLQLTKRLADAAEASCG